MSPRKPVAAAPANTADAEIDTAAFEKAIAAAPDAPALPPCALEGAPENSKCVVSRTDEVKSVRLLTPDRVIQVSRDDIFYTLPAGVKVQKAKGGRFRVFNLGANPDVPLFDCASARDAVKLFLQKA